MKRFYWIVRNSQRVGPFGLEALQEKVNSGEFGGSDFVFYPGCKGLERLSSVEGIKIAGGGSGSGSPAPPPVPPSPTPLAEYNPLPPIRQTVSLANPVMGTPTGVQQQAPPPPEKPQSAPPPRARMPEPGSMTERLPERAPRPEPRTVAPRVTARVILDVVEDAPTEGTGNHAYPLHSAPHLRAQDTAEPRKPTKVVSRRELAREKKDKTERLDPLLPHLPNITPNVTPGEGAEGTIEIDFSSIEAALQKPAPTGASVKIPAPVAGARPLSNLSSVGAEEALPLPDAAPAAPRIVTKRITASTPPHLRGERPVLQPVAAFSEEMFSKQTMVVNAPSRVARPKRAADAAYPQVISKPETTGTLTDVPKEEPREVLDSVKYTELARPAEATPVVTPEFTNSLGMGFVQVPNVPLGFGLWQVRVRDFRAFCDASGYDAGPKWRSPDFLQLEDNPVIFVSWLDAQEFCQWLTTTEQQAGWIDADQFYRLPSDIEWSAAVDLRNELGNTPAQRHGRLPDIYPWGKQWPPPERIGNFADESAARRLGWEPVAPGYDDGQVFTAKVGTYHVSNSGVYDLSGNVWEWVEDWFDETETRRTLRGGSWTSSAKEELFSCARDADMPNARRGKNGFRIVLAAI